MIKKIKNCECKSCQSACKFNPGWFLPGEAEKAAKLLDMDFIDFFKKYLGVNWYEKQRGDIFLLAPAITTMDTGKEYPGDPRGMCIFFEAGRCKIHGAKPHECREYTHENTKKEIDERLEAVADAWNTKRHQKQISSLLGRKPQSESFSIFDMIYGGMRL